ncbi:hypothetical protein KR767_09985 [Luteibacter anthropi]|uniref:hypothetical protein n=1 Tax=Luteibacter anthropi TaxID=564369 RepID=UPI002032562E|nr:hypothetical protein [Luteibacter anthropi]URX64344.1 hypothetical protein KR767_09985 [Luteibacter anthropi]
MKANLKGLVQRLKLENGKGMMPLYEAISNSMDAIIEAGKTGTAGRIDIRLIPLQDLGTNATEGRLVVDGVEVTDNGIGLDDGHLADFREAHTISKLKAGGKGVGRFTYLKVFDEVRVVSIFGKDGEHRLRDFPFDFGDEDLTKADATTFVEEPTGTTVTMKGMASQYRASWPTNVEGVGRRIIEHFLIRFASQGCPQITVSALGFSNVDVNRLFDTTVVGQIQEATFDVKGQQFTVQVLRQLGTSRSHEYHLCATSRDVASAKLKELLPELPDRFVGEDGKAFSLIALITGEYLDENANQERTTITFETDEGLELDRVSISRRALNKAIGDTLRTLLAEDLRVTNAEKIAQIERFVEKAPEYRVLTHERYRARLESRVSPGLTDIQLDETLLHIRREIEDEVSREEKSLAARMEKESFDKYQEKFKVLMEELNEVGKAKLASYVAHRRTLLDLVDASLKKSRTDDKYPLEKVLHKMVFPMGASSKDVFFEQQNLWLIDERLSFHTLLTSDVAMKKAQGLEDTSAKEPDILALFWDRPVAIAEPEALASGGVVIVEFKRPGRDDYNKDPGDQIIQRFVEIAKGGVKDVDGRPINPTGVRYHGFLIADLTPSLKNHVAFRYIEAFDGEGYFLTLPGGNGHVEIISYDKLIRLATQRNRMLFDKLGVHKH